MILNLHGQLKKNEKFIMCEENMLIFLGLAIIFGALEIARAIRLK